MIIVSKYWVPKGFTGITLYPFIFLKNKKDIDNSSLITHEKIHLLQQAELLIIFFYLWYSLEYIIRLIQYKNKHIAYRNICFEREAYANQNKKDYIRNRKIWSFTSYLKQ